MTSSPLVDRVVETTLPTRHGTFRLLGYRDTMGHEHVALVMGPTGAAAGGPTLVRLHSECLTGDALGSRRCDCGEQLDLALALVAREGRGAVLYLRGHEGRGIGLVEKLRAYALQDEGLDTVDANVALGHPADARDYAAAAGMLLDLGLHSIVLLSSNPAKQEAIEAFGVDVADRRSLIVADRAENSTYLATKRARMQHDAPAERTLWDRLSDGDVPTQVVSSSDHMMLRRYGPLADAGPRVVVAQLAQSLDGFIASRTGKARHVSGPQDREHLHRLRALVDAVIVGASTVVNDDPQLTVRSVPGENPVRVVLDPRGRIRPSARVLTEPASPTLWVRAGDDDRDDDRDADRAPSDPALSDRAPSDRAPTDRALADHVEVVVLPLNDEGRFEPSEVLALLSRRGLGRVLVEGGGVTVSAFLHAEVLDTLYLTTAPLLIGDGVPGLRFSGHDSLSRALRPQVHRYQLGDDVCTEITLSGRASRSV